MGQPLLLHSTQFTTSIHLSSFCVNNGVINHSVLALHAEDQLRNKCSALRCIRTVISNPKYYLVDDLIMAILSLAANERSQIKVPLFDPSPFTPPLQSLQWLDQYAAYEFHPLHWDAMLVIIRQHGGIHKVKKYGIAWMVTLFVAP